MSTTIQNVSSRTRALKNHDTIVNLLEHDASMTNALSTFTSKELRGLCALHCCIMQRNPRRSDFETRLIDVYSRHENRVMQSN